MHKRDSILCTTFAMLVLLLLSHSPNTNNHCNRHRRLLLRSNFSLSDDVTNIEVHIFPETFVAPTDDELTQWSFKQAQRELEFHDKDHDGYISYPESGPPSWLQQEDTDDYWWKEEHFNASDEDGDRRLNLTEFNDFLNPADSNSPKLRQWLCKAKIRERDTDRDGKVNFKEFFHWLLDLLRRYDKESSGDLMYASAKALFSQIDKDRDGYLSDMELLPIIGILHPSWHHYARQHTDYIMSQAEVDKDGRVIMIKYSYLFYSAIFNNDKDEYDDSHDEVF